MSDAGPRSIRGDGPSPDWRSFLEDRYTDELIAIFVGESDDRILRVDWEDIERMDWQLAERIFDGDGSDIIDDIRDAILTVDVTGDGRNAGELSAGVAGDRLDIDVAIANIPDSHTHDIGDFRPDMVERHLAIVGQVSVLDKVHLSVEAALFECGYCGYISGDGSIPPSEGEGPNAWNEPIVQPPGDKLEVPGRCAGCEKGGGLSLSLEHSVTSSRQVALLTPPPEVKSKSMSGDIEIQLLGQLVGEIHGGERIKAFGELQARPIKDGSRVFEYFMDVNSIEVLDGSTTAVDVDEWEEEIDAIAASADPVQVLKDSFAPDIHRHGPLDDIIEAVLIQMAGATATDRYRSDIHVMLLGDPGTGKSKILKAAEEIHPRAKYKNGESVTAAGLTAAATKDDFGSTAWTLKPGLLVLTNGGMAILDEIDKASDDAVSSLHSVLERQTAAVSKAGIDAELPAATSLLAAGNPEGSRFDPSVEAIYMQIGFPASILSRFDLVFLIQDRPGGDADADIARQIADSFVDSTGLATGSDVASTVEPAYPPEALTAYLAFARDRVHPVVEDPAVIDPIVDTFRRKRADRDPESPVPMTARFVDSMIRIAHASARLRLSDVVEPEDVDRAVQLVELSIDQTMTDSNGLANPAGASTEPENITKLRQEIKSVIKDAGSGGIPKADFWEYFEYHGYSKSNVSELVDRLERTGRLTKINGTFRLT